ncbi:MmyB family transcriptional regulator [Micromonospora lupini]|uniref:MmyB family transcriptional regulator n=1 Tax=Micromonospora lupini TaxID=285679 RepID=UPI0031D85467
MTPTSWRTWWHNHRVHERTHGTKHMVHPAVGPMTIRYEALALPGDDDQTLFIYTTGTLTSRAARTGHRPPAIPSSHGDPVA